MTDQKLKILFAGGGTAGHLLPALATEDALRSIAGGRGYAEVSTNYLATRKGAEFEILKRRGSAITVIPKTDFPRKLNIDSLTFLPRLIVALIRTIPRALNVDVIVGFGGYVALPAYLAAAILRKPLIIHEANALPGLANRIGKALARRAFSNFPLEGWSAGDVIGLPIRDSIAQISQLSGATREAQVRSARIEFGMDPERKTLLIFGGSLGAQRLNDVTREALPELFAKGYQILHVVGNKNELPAAQPGYFPHSYITNMERAYLSANVVVARSGAGSCAELAAVGVPALLVPLNVGNGEQLMNALQLASSGVAHVVKNDELTAEELVNHVEALSHLPIKIEIGKKTAALRLSEEIIEEITEKERNESR